MQSRIGHLYSPSHLRHQINHKHEVKQDAPHVGVAVTLATDCQLQELRTVLYRLTI